MMVVEAIIKKLNTEFPNSDIYGEEITQGFEEPCFFVQQIQNTRKDEIQSNETVASFDIHYFLEEHTEDINKLYEEMGYKLYEVMKVIELECGRKLRAIQRNFEIIDGVLHFKVTYKFYLLEINSSEKMKSLDVKGSVKDG